MTTERVRKLLHLADELDPGERVELADELLHSVPSGDDEDAGDALHLAWADELRRRIDDVDAGRADLVSHDDAKATIRAAIASAHRE
jgi:putative addiction module component (TIGR02574 family)